MAYWNRNARAERPEWPKLVPLSAPIEEAKAIEPDLLAKDPDAEIVEGGQYGVFARCHNEASVTVAKRFGKSRKK